ncbi:hypothetical protein NI389_08275 [Pseudoalteromonas xiamenensis]|nr:hypothetical protein [Pseudoalteromonas xiamenensis]WMN61362.1 hypothetical protein NI389_08275 [Pseudoalteromonas xiamenensis]
MLDVEKIYGGTYTGKGDAKPDEKRVALPPPPLEVAVAEEEQKVTP